MFYLIVLLTIILILESVATWQKKFHKTSLKITIANVLQLIINLVILIPSLKNEYSTIIYLRSRLINNPFLIIIWIILNLAIIFYIMNYLKILTKKRKQSQPIRYAFYILSILISILLAIIILGKLTPWILLLLCLSIICFLIKDYIERKMNYILLLTIILSMITFYSFFTYTGSARLNIALMGYPIAAYQTGLEEIRYLEEENTKKYYPVKKIAVENGDMGLIIVKNYVGIKISRYLGF